VSKQKYNGHPKEILQFTKNMINKTIYQTEYIISRWMKTDKTNRKNGNFAERKK
jgi:hypothetical protein